VISRIRGRAIAWHDDTQSVEIDTGSEAGGLVYEVRLPTAVWRALEEDRPEALNLFTHYHVPDRAPVPVLIGFLRQPERDFFRKLIGVPQMGVAKAQQALYTSRNIPFQKEIVLFKNFDTGYKKGDILTCSLFKKGEYVDIIGWSKGKGYQGVIKRYGFGGGRASHGSKFHREVGSTGMAAYPAKTLKNTKMAGRIAVRRTTVQNLPVISVDTEKGVLLIRGAGPGPTGRKIIVRNALKKRRDID